MKCYLAIDIGASSGRHILGWWENGKIKAKEIYRFPNGVTEQAGHLTWDMESLVSHVRRGIEKAKVECSEIVSLSVDTWGVDYVLMQGDTAVFPVYAYRDDRTKEAVEKVHGKISFSNLYQRTGIQFQPFNTIYQLYADQLAGRLKDTTDFLMIPEYLIYRLCGVKVHEYTNATTGGMVNAETGEYDPEIIAALGLPEHLFPKLAAPGTVAGEYEGIKVVLCATHDTGSAVEGIPMVGNNPYISSGTWSLLGVKTEKPITNRASELANYSNEGGVGYNRYQKNIMGMWPVNELKRELCPDTPFSEIDQAAVESTCETVVDINDPEFFAPKSMKSVFDEKSGNTLHTIGDYFCCAYRSLAVSYQTALAELERNTGKTYKTLYIVGGGAKNKVLNELTRKITGKEVVALPIEATAIGNLKVQMEGMEC